MLTLWIQAACSPRANASSDWGKARSRHVEYSEARAGREPFFSAILNPIRCGSGRARRSRAPVGSPGLGLGFQPINAKIIVRRLDGRMAFVPEGQVDSSQARSAWVLLLLASDLSRDRFNRPAGTGYFPHDSRHFVPGFQALRAWLLSRCPSGTKAILFRSS
jgi:hypothetical protein